MKVYLILVSLSLGVLAFPGKSDIANSGQRIVGGSAASIEDFPYIAQLYRESILWCGSCIIATKWVLTAGHCIEGENVDSITLRAGSSKFNQTADEPITLEEIYLHPLYNYTNYDYDISILHLTKDLTFGTTIGSVTLPSANVVLSAGTVATMVGWGYLSYDGPDPTQLQEVTLPIITNEECAVRYDSTLIVITDNTLCAGSDEGGKDSCSGDSGGPLTVDGVLYGLASKGLGCGDAKYPGVYTNVSSIRSYIEEVTGV